MSSSKNKRDPESAEKRKKRKLEKKKKENRNHDDSLTSTTTTTSSTSENIKKKGKVSTTTESIQQIKHDNKYEQSPFEGKQVQILVSLSPSALVNIPSALNTSMQSLLLKYSDSLGGVLISYNDIQLDDSTSDGKRGRIINEMPHIHYQVKCNVLVFNPSPGTVLKGKVNESFPSHIGLLVHELFNGMISAELLRRNGFTFDDETHEWRKHENSVDRIIKIDDAMEFTVDRLHECNGLISLDCKDPVFLDQIESS